MNVIIKTLIEGLGLRALLFLVCAFGIRNGAVSGDAVIHKVRGSGKYAV